MRRRAPVIFTLSLTITRCQAVIAASEVWSEEERQEFVAFIAANPEAGTLIRGSGGCRKVRWSRAGTGKGGGARVIYFLAGDEVVWLLIVYVKAKFDALPASFLAQLRQGVQDAL